MDNASKLRKSIYNKNFAKWGKASDDPAPNVNAIKVNL